MKKLKFRLLFCAHKKHATITTGNNVGRQQT